jgi:hypothetical protein
MDPRALRRAGRRRLPEGRSLVTAGKTGSGPDGRELAVAGDRSASPSPSVQDRTRPSGAPLPPATSAKAAHAQASCAQSAEARCAATAQAFPWVRTRLNERPLEAADGSAVTRVTLNGEVLDLDAGGDNARAASSDPDHLLEMARRCVGDKPGRGAGDIVAYCRRLASASEELRPKHLWSAFVAVHLHCSPRHANMLASVGRHTPILETSPQDLPTDQGSLCLLARLSPSQFAALKARCDLSPVSRAELKRLIATDLRGSSASLGKHPSFSASARDTRREGRRQAGAPSTRRHERHVSEPKGIPYGPTAAREASALCRGCMTWTLPATSDFVSFQFVEAPPQPRGGGNQEGRQ